MKPNSSHLFATLAAIVLPFAAASLFAQDSTKSAGKEVLAKSVTPEEAEKLITNKKDIVVVDVRTHEEFSVGHIAGAKNVSLLDSDFDQKIKAFEGKSILVHCASGARSARALIKMTNLQFPEIYHMNAGMKGWQSAGKPVVKDTQAP